MQVLSAMFDRLQMVAAWALLALSPFVILWGTIFYQRFARIEETYRAWRGQPPSPLHTWGKTRQGEMILRNAAVVAGLLGTATAVGRLFGGDVFVLDVLSSHIAPVLRRVTGG